MVSQAGNPQAGSTQASPEDNTISQAESVISQASNTWSSKADIALHLAENTISQALLIGSTLSQTESAISQAGNSQVFLADSTLFQAESAVLPRHSQQSGTLQGLGPHKLPLIAIHRQVVPLTIPLARQATPLG